MINGLRLVVLPSKRLKNKSDMKPLIWLQMLNSFTLQEALFEFQTVSKKTKQKKHNAVRSNEYTSDN